MDKYEDYKKQREKEEKETFEKINHYIKLVKPQGYDRMGITQKRQVLKTAKVMGKEDTSFEVSICPVELAKVLDLNEDYVFAWFTSSFNGDIENGLWLLENYPKEVFGYAEKQIVYELT